MKGKSSELFKPTLVLTCFALVSAVLIGITYVVTAGPLEIRRQEAAASALIQLLPATHTSTTEELDIYGSYLTNISRSYAADGSFVGYVFSANPQGFAGTIHMMVAFNPEGVIEGLSVISHTETPGIGTIIEEDWFARLFVGRSGMLRSARQSAGPQEIDITAGATVSLDAIITGVNSATQFLAEGPLSEFSDILAAPPEVSSGNIAAEMFADGHRASSLEADIIFDENNTIIGYVISVNPQGFSGDIHMMVAFNLDGYIEGINIISHSETPGIGTVIEEDWFIEQFIGKSNTQEIDAVAAATVSTVAVTEGVNKAIRLFEILTQR